MLIWVWLSLSLRSRVSHSPGCPQTRSNPPASVCQRRGGMRLKTFRFIPFCTKHIRSGPCRNTHKKICTGEEEGVSYKKTTLQETISGPSLPGSMFPCRPRVPPVTPSKTGSQANGSIPTQRFPTAFQGSYRGHQHQSKLSRATPRAPG